MTPCKFTSPNTELHEPWAKYVSSCDQYGLHSRAWQELWARTQFILKMCFLCEGSWTPGVTLPPSGGKTLSYSGSKRLQVSGWWPALRDPARSLQNSINPSTGSNSLRIKRALCIPEMREGRMYRDFWEKCGESMIPGCYYAAEKDIFFLLWMVFFALELTHALDLIQVHFVSWFSARLLSVVVHSLLCSPPFRIPFSLFIIISTSCDWTDAEENLPA